jgi:hypothetical protein
MLLKSARCVRCGSAVDFDFEEICEQLGVRERGREKEREKGKERDAFGDDKD